MNSELLASIEVAPSELGASLSAVRLCAPEAQQQMQASMLRLGQLTPVHAYRAGTSLEIFDGLKRARAARELSWATVQVQVHGVDAPGAKVRLLLCNQASVLSELEEAWLVRSLYREDRMSQPQIAQLLNRHKSWVCRRLALCEDLTDELTANVRLGLVSATAAVELARLQRCNQDAVAAVAMRRGLTTRQVSRLVDALLLAPNEQWQKLLEQADKPINAPGPKAKAARCTPSEQLLMDASAMKRLTVRLHARLLERSIESHGPSAILCGELKALFAALRSLQETLALRLASAGVRDAAA